MEDSEVGMQSGGNILAAEQTTLIAHHIARELDNFQVALINYLK